ncbi:MAG: acyltransferase [Acidobacteriota bacterium]|nr:acyltransferase [Acidobacteriota bacterium]
MRRPDWLPSYIPELQGLRGLAVLGVLFYHCHPRLEHTWLLKPALWGWAGVNLFFVLSGFLITSILMESREKPHYFKNFYARRVLRIWPVYVLILVFVYAEAPWYIGPGVWDAVRTAPWWAYILFLQNMFHIALPPALGPTWSLAIEEQYYFVWAPVVRFLRRPVYLATLLIVILIGCPLLRMHHFSWLTPTHTLIHLDGIALGSLIALALYTLAFTRRTWLISGLSAFVLGTVAVFTVAAGNGFLDSALAIAFAGVVLTMLASSGARTPVHVLLRRGPLAYYGKISYGLYMTHIATFIFFGWFDLKMDPYGVAGNLAIVAFRFLMATLVATALWYGFESRILKLKRYF